jgi:hypothetical protein
MSNDLFVTIPLCRYVYLDHAGEKKFLFFLLNLNRAGDEIGDGAAFISLQTLGP